MDNDLAARDIEFLWRDLALVSCGVSYHPSSLASLYQVIPAGVKIRVLNPSVALKFWTSLSIEPSRVHAGTIPVPRAPRALALVIPDKPL
ncbi:MAG: hypothetical protein OXE51_08860, partial [Gammaproteobacteria bacterium]|nr:hypothetical protein [Gammaproteobacteria bacterium]